MAGPLLHSGVAEIEMHKLGHFGRGSIHIDIYITEDGSLSGMAVDSQHLCVNLFQTTCSLTDNILSFEPIQFGGKCQVEVTMRAKKSEFEHVVIV